MHKKIIPLLLLIAIGVSLKGQITLQIADVESCTSPVEVPIIIQETVTLISLQFSLQWDGTGLMYTGHTAPIFPTGSAFGGPIGDTLSFSWFEFTGYTLNAGDTIFSLLFNLTGTPGNSYDVEFYTGSNTSFPATEAAGPGFISIPVTEVDGSVTYGDVNPTFVGCPSNITMSTDPAGCDAVVTWTEPTVIDCDNNANPFTSTHSPGATFPLGTTTVTYSVSDTDGNMGSCSFDVIVEDNEAPTITCSVTDITVNVPMGTTSTVVNDPGLIPATSDNCPGESLSYVRSGVTSDSGSGNTNGLSFNTGVTTVTYTVTDGNMNTDICTVNVHVIQVAANAITLQILNDTVGCNGGMAQACIVVLEDVELVSLQFSVNWDGTALSYIGNTPPIFSSGFGFGQTGDTLSFSWFDFTGFNLFAGDTIFCLQFNASGTLGTCYDVEFYTGTNPLITPLEAAGPGFVSVPVNTIDGAVCIFDTTPPMITCPGAITIECDESTGTANTGNATATDDCNPNPTITFLDANNLSGCNGTGTITRTFTADDGNGNTSSCDQIITVQDMTNPTFDSSPASLLDISCGDPFPTQETLTASDNCGSATVTPTQSFTTDVCNGYVVTYTWTAEDDCMNTATTSVTFNVQPDNSGPTFDSTPNPISDISCGDPFPVQETLTATDDCGMATVTPSQSFVTDICNGYLVTYTWTAEDDCTNTTTTSITFNVLADNSGPTFDSPPNPITDISCGDPFPVQQTLTATDDCGNATVTPSQSFITDICNGYVVTYTWIAEDDCMNTTTTSITFNVLPDNSGPTFDSPPNPIADISCGDPFPVQQTLTATDDCGNATVTPSQSFVTDICNGYVVTYTWTAEDDCMNTTVETVTFNVLPDNSGPTFDSPPSPLADISCGDPFPVQETLTATDDCGNATVVPSQSFVEDICNGYVVTYTWIAEDDCMNTTVEIVTFNVLPDNTGPAFDNSPNPLADINCGDPFPIQQTLTATDDCGSATVVPSQSFVEDICGGYVVTYTWIAEDDCMNTNVETVTFNVLPDNAGPTFDSSPSPLANISCGDPFPIQETLTATDDCGNTTVVPSQFFVEDICGGYVVTYTWIATDDCLNTSVETITFNVLPDMAGPSFTVPSDITLMCQDDPLNTSLTGVPTNVIDNCSTFTSGFVDDNSNLTGCNGAGVIIRTWTVSDACGNDSSLDQEITIEEDTTPPTISCPADETLEWPVNFNTDPVPLNVPQGTNIDPILIYDNLEAYSAGPVLGQSANWQTWTPNTVSESAIVSSEQALSGSQSLKVQGVSSGGPVNQLFLLGDRATGNWQLSFWLYLPTGNGGYLNLQHYESPGVEYGNDFYFDGDGTGNIVYNGTSQTFTYPEDTWFEVKQFINIPLDISTVVLDGIQLATWPFSNDRFGVAGIAQIGALNFYPSTQNGSIPLYYVDDISLTSIPPMVGDNCGVESIDFQDAFMGLDPINCPNIATVERTWTVTDYCGLTAQCVQTFTFTDTTPPTALCQDITIQLDANGMASLNAVDIDNGSLDSCSATVTLSIPPTTFSCSDTGVNVVVLTVIDDCNNSSTCSANVTVEDNISPVISCPNDTTLMVVGNMTSLVVNNLSPVGLDNCSGFSIAYSTTGATSLTGTNDISGESFNLGTTSVSYTITDASGNQSSCIFDVTVNGSVTIDCPSDTSINVASGTCAAVVNNIPLVITSGSSLVDSIYFELTGATTGSGTPDASGSTFNLGVTTVTYTVKDDMGNLIVCSFDVTVVDNEAPQISCPLNTMVTTLPGDTNIAVLNIDPVASDLCGMVSITYNLSGATTDSGSGSASGLIFNLGLTTVTYTASDESGNSANCSFDITVNFGGSLTLVNCPNDSILGTDDLFCGATVQNIAPIVLIPQNEVSSISYTINGATTSSGADDASGETFNVGTSVIQYIVTNTVGIMDSCEFTVTVIDDDDPTATCVPLDAFTADPGTCAKVVTNNLLPMTSDNCGVDSISYEISGATTGSGNGSATGTTFNVGISLLTYTIFDAAGNSTTCSSTVQVNDDEAPVGLVCPTDTFILVNVGITEANVTNIGISGFSDNCGLDSIAYILSGATVANGENDASGLIFQLGLTAVTYEVYDVNGNSSTCSFNVMVSDAQNAIVCPLPQVANTGTNNCTAVVSNLTPIIVLDSMFVDSVTYAISGATLATGSGDASGQIFNEGISILTYYVYSNGMASDSCSTTIEVSDFENPQLSNCPQDVILFAAENCEAIHTWDLPTASDNCSIDQVINPPFNSGDGFPIGTTTITYTVIDPSGNSAECSFTVTVEDNRSPIITGPSDFTISADSSFCFGTGFWTDPIAVDSCSGILSLSSNFSPFDVFPLGSTEIIYTAVDSAGNSSLYSFEITVEDDEAPLIANCPPPDLMVTSIGNCEVIATWTEPTVTDNCGISSFTSTINSGDTLSQNSTVTYFATDQSGNVSQCQFDISIMDLQPPVWVSVPGDTTLSTDMDLCTAFYSWTDPVATDDCGTVNIVSSHSNGSQFQTGAPTIVTLTGTDNGGNMITHLFSITVEDNEAPQINCPGNITIREDGLVVADPSGLIGSIDTGENCSGLTLSLNSLQASDNCDGSISGIQTGGEDLTQALGVGMYSADFGFTDSTGNASACTVNITIQALPQIELAAEPSNIGCPGDNIQIGPTMIIDMSTISWSGPNFFSSDLIAPTIELSTATVGIYTGVFTTANGCSSSADIELSMNEAPQFSASSNSPVCNTTLDLAGTSSSGPEISSWDWSGPCSFSDSGQNISIPDLDPNCSGTYTLTVTTVDGCTASQDIEVESSQLPAPTLSNDCGSVVCLGEFCMLIGTEYLQGAVDYTWLAAPGLGLPINTNNNELVIFPTQTGSYDVEYSVTVDGCSSDVITQTILVVGGPQGEDDFYQVPFETIYQGSSILDNDQIFSSYTLDVVNSTDFGNLTLNQDGTFTYIPFNGFTGIDGFEYEICQECGENECERVSVILRVEYDGECIVPTYLSPNDDGKNDILRILCLDSNDYPNNELMIFNRWGDLVFEASPYLNDWKGTRDAEDGKDLPDGTYFFMFKMDENSSGDKGYITILR